MVHTENNNFSIIIPTFKEAKNIQALIARIANINFSPRLFEVIIVDDDSNDGTKEIMTLLKKQYEWLHLVIRTKNKSLSASVIEGFKQAIFPICIVMDADLSHPPEKIPELLIALSSPATDLVIGSRYIAGGSSDESWPIIRKLFSRLAAFPARLLISLPIKDPLSGFIAVKKTMLAKKELNPLGWKIGLEIIIKCQCKNIIEVPIHFSSRTHGFSKLNIKVFFDYLRHIHHLIWFKIFLAP